MDQKPPRTRGCLSLSQWIYTTYFQPACHACCSLLHVLVQFPIATSWTKRDFSVDRLLWKISFLPSTASTSVDHCGRCCTFVLSSSLSFIARKERSGWRGGERGESRLLHMSVAMGILAQWLCSNAAAGMEDLFSQGRLWQKKKMECAWAGASATNYVAGAFILERELARLYLDRERGAASETFDVFILPHRPD